MISSLIDTQRSQKQSKTRKIDYDKEVKIALAAGLKDFEIKMPQYLSVSGDEGAPTSNLKTIFDAFAIKQLKALSADKR